MFLAQQHFFLGLERTREVLARGQSVRQTQLQIHAKWVAMVHSVAIVGAGRMGQQYAMAYKTYPDTEIVAFVDPNVERTPRPASPSGSIWTTFHPLRAAYHSPSGSV